MALETKTLRAEIKAADDDGSPLGMFTAYVSIFGNVDMGGDRIIKGAFAASLAEWAASGDPLPVIWSHEWHEPESHIGYVVKAEERDEGLFIEAQLDVTDNPRAAYVARLLKKRRVREFSFGYFAKAWSYVEDPEHGLVREIIEIEVFEVGPTLLGMNPDTRLVEAASALARDLKAGRVLSGKNEQTLRQAHDLIGQVLSAVAAKDDAAGMQDDPASEDGKAASTDPEPDIDSGSTGDTAPTVATDHAKALIERTSRYEGN